MIDSTAGAGEVIYSNESSGAYDVVTQHKTDIAGTPTIFMELDGVSETVDMLKPTVLQAGDIIITEIASGAKSGSDTTLITGTAGTNTYAAVWNADGDLVNGPGVPLVSGGNIGAATGTSLIVSGKIDGVTNVLSTTAATTITAATHGRSAYFFNNAATEAAGTYTLPTWEAGMQYCFKNGTTTNQILTVTQPASAFMYLVGVSTTAGTGHGIAIPAGLGSSVCLVAGDVTNSWYVFPGTGTPAAY